MGAVADLRCGAGPPVVAQENQRPQSPESPPHEAQRRILDSQQESVAAHGIERGEALSIIEEGEPLQRTDEQAELAAQRWRARRQRSLDDPLHLRPPPRGEPRRVRHHRLRPRAGTRTESLEHARHLGPRLTSSKKVAYSSGEAKP